MMSREDGDSGRSAVTTAKRLEGIPMPCGALALFAHPDVRARAFPDGRRFTRARDLPEGLLRPQRDGHSTAGVKG